MFLFCCDVLVVVLFVPWGLVRVLDELRYASTSSIFAFAVMVVDISTIEEARSGRMSATGSWGSSAEPAAAREHDNLAFERALRECLSAQCKQCKQTDRQTDR